MKDIAKIADRHTVNEQRKIDDEIEEIEYRVSLEYKNFIDNLSVAKTNTQSRQVNLPRIKYQTFTGNRYEWRGWWAAFKSGFHKNSELTTVEKVQYLKT